MFKYANVPLTKVEQFQFAQDYSKKVIYKLSFPGESVVLSLILLFTIKQKG